jgi:hypothetical protein
VSALRDKVVAAAVDMVAEVVAAEEDEVAMVVAVADMEAEVVAATGVEVAADTATANAARGATDSLDAMRRLMLGISWRLASSFRLFNLEPGAALLLVIEAGWAHHVDSATARI